MRLALAGLLVLLAAPVEAQALTPGTRVRVAYPTASGGNDLVTGTLLAAGDSLAVETAAGDVLALPAVGLDRVEVSAGRPPFPVLLVAAGTAAGLGAGYAFAQTAPTRDRCLTASRAICATERSGEYGLRIAVGTAAGAALSTWAALRLWRERWVPAGELAVSPGAVSWRLGL